MSQTEPEELQLGTKRGVEDGKRCWKVKERQGEEEGRKTLDEADRLEDLQRRRAAEDGQRLQEETKPRLGLETGLQPHYLQKPFPSYQENLH